MLPWFNTIKFLADATEITNNQATLNLTSNENVIVEGTRLDWALMSNYSINRSAVVTYDLVNDNVTDSWFISPPPQESFNFLFVNLAVYFLIAWWASLTPRTALCLRFFGSYTSHCMRMLIPSPS